MKKLNLGKLRCSTASSSKGYPSSSRSSTKNQSQATISSFFINKSCSKDENKVTAKSAKSTVKVGFYCTKQSWRDCTKLKIRIIYAMLSFHYEIRPDQALLLTEDLPPTSPPPPPIGFHKYRVTVGCVYFVLSFYHCKEAMAMLSLFHAFHPDIQMSTRVTPAPVSPLNRVLI